MTELVSARGARDLVTLRGPELSVMGERFKDQGPPQETRIVLSLAERRNFYVTREVQSFDRELRRTAARYRRAGSLPVLQAIAESLSASRTLEAPAVRRNGASDSKPMRNSLRGTTPDAPQLSSLVMVAAEPGSINFLLEPMGYLITLLNSDAMDAVANAAAWSGPVVLLRAWFKRKDDRLNGSGRDVLSALSQGGGDPAGLVGDADQSLNFVGPELELPDGTVMRGRRRIVVQQTHSDGSSSIFSIE